MRRHIEDTFITHNISRQYKKTVFLVAAFIWVSVVNLYLGVCGQSDLDATNTK